MREIKFRAWDVSRRKYQIIEDLYWFEENGVLEFEDSNYVFEQFTGLRDKNGKEIYEGDIVSGCGSIADVRYREEIAAFERFAKQGPAVLSKLHSEIIEVIGNIHENPELLT